jgi:hypothetical protein
MGGIMRGALGWLMMLAEFGDADGTRHLRSRPRRSYRL